MKINLKKELIGHIILIVSLLICLWPIVFLVSASLKRFKSNLSVPFESATGKSNIIQLFYSIGPIPYFPIYW